MEINPELKASILERIKNSHLKEIYVLAWELVYYFEKTYRWCKKPDIENHIEFLQDKGYFKCKYDGKIFHIYEIKSLN